MVGGYGPLLPMAQKPETKLRNKIRDVLVQRGAYCAHPHGSQYSASDPDLLVCYQGQFIGLEIKTPQNKKGATPAQREKLKQIKRAGGRSAVVRSVRGAVWFVTGEKITE